MRSRLSFRMTKKGMFLRIEIIFPYIRKERRIENDNNRIRCRKGAVGPQDTEPREHRCGQEAKASVPTPARKEESEFISKEEVLAGIESGLRDLKAGRKTPAREFLNELREEV